MNRRIITLAFGGFLLLIIAAVGLMNLRSPTDTTQDSTSQPPIDPKTIDPNALVATMNPATQEMAAGLGGAMVSSTGEARDFRSLSADQSKALEALARELRQTSDEGRKLEILEELEVSYYSEALLPLLREILADPGATFSEEFRFRAIEMLSGNTSPAILSALSLAMNDNSEALREEAVVAAGQLRGPEVVEFLGRGLNDPNPQVRLATLDTTEFQTSGNQQKILEMALGSDHSDIAVAGIALLEVQSNHAAVETLIRGLEAPNPDVVEEVRFALDFMLGIEFQNASQARTWWRENRGKFDPDLNPIE